MTMQKLWYRGVLILNPLLYWTRFIHLTLNELIFFWIILLYWMLLDFALSWIFFVRWVKNSWKFFIRNKKGCFMKCYCIERFLCIMNILVKWIKTSENFPFGTSRKGSLTVFFSFFVINTIEIKYLQNIKTRFLFRHGVCLHW